MESRYQTFKKFENFAQNKDSRSMDELCTTQDNVFSLQTQQLFLRDYIQKNPEWKSLLLYHEIGSGKTCTSITMAEEYLRVHPNNKIKVILPARLKSNFIDELISPCGMEKYISKDDFKLFNSSEASAKVKKQINTKFMRKIGQHYELLSFEKFKSNALLFRTNLKQWSKDFTENSMVIIDEVHNLMSDKHNRKETEKFVEEGRLLPSAGNPKGMNTILFKFLTKYAHPSCKMVFLTATPIFDNIQQLKEVGLALNPNFKITNGTKVIDVIEAMRGKVSYFPGTSENAYPTVENKDERILMSRTQQERTLDIINKSKGENEDDDRINMESFFAKQRQVSLACLPNNRLVKPANYDEVISNLKEYSPKFLHFLTLLEQNPQGKHLVYSNFIKSGLRVLEAALKQRGWVNLFDVVNKPTEWNKHKNKVYAIWDGGVKDANKQIIKSVANNKNNIFGDKVRLILGSPSVKEGISFKHIQHMHVFDPFWNFSSIKQVEGRAVRYCSHVDINEIENAPLKRNVVIHRYIITKNPQYEWKENVKTCDELIYEDVIPKKRSFVHAGQEALKKVAMDYYLFRNMYGKRHKPNPISPILGSPLSDSETSPWMQQLQWGKNQQVKNTVKCPKYRRPDSENNCPPGYYLKMNRQNEPCCYKERKAAAN